MNVETFDITLDLFRLVEWMSVGNEKDRRAYSVDQALERIDEHTDIRADGAQGNTDRHESIAVASGPSTVVSSSTVRGSSANRPQTVGINRWAKNTMHRC